MEGKSATIDSLGNIYVIGNNGNNHLHIIKYHSSGTPIWSRDMSISYGGTSVYSACDKNGNFYFSFDYGDNRFFLTKYDSSGNHKWDKSFYPGGVNTYTEGIATDTSGNVFITGESRLDVYYYYTIKFNSQGDTLWTARYNYNYGGSVPYSIYVDKPGNVYVTGISWGDGNNSDFLTIKYNSSGTLQWIRRYNGPYNDGDYAYCVKVDDEGYCYVTGGVSTGDNHVDIGTIKYSSNGDSVWTRLYITQTYRNWSYGIDILFDDYKNIYVLGRGGDTNYSGAIIGGFQLIKYSENGNFIYNIIDTNGVELDPGIRIKNDIYLTGKSKYYAGIYTSGYNLQGNRVFSSYYPNIYDSIYGYTAQQILSFRDNYFLVFGSNYDSSFFIKYSTSTGIINQNQNVVKDYKLYQNYPNPFNPVTKVKFQIPNSSFVTLKVFDILGKEIEILLDKKLNSGIYECVFEGGNLPSGIYFYSIFINGNKLDTKKMVLIK
jgi:hypothetical protein